VPADVAYFVIPGLWFAWLAYWVYAARDTKATERTESTASRLTHTIPLAIAGWIIAANRWRHGWLDGVVFDDRAAAFVVGALLVAGGLGFAIWARGYLGRNWSSIVTVKQDHELVRSGPYRFVRHPIYTGILLGFVGSALARDEWRGAVAIAIAAFALWRKLQIEERWMIERFGDAYLRYRREVPALIPNPFARPAAP